MRSLCTLAELRAMGVTRAAREHRWRRVEHGIYAEGTEPITELDRAVATVIATGGVASGRLAATLLCLDGIELRGADVTVSPGSSNRRPGVRRRPLPPEAIVVVDGIRCTSAVQTLRDLASEVDDLRWEQALESALRHRLTSVAEISGAAFGTRGADRIRRVLALRPPGAPATESLLETLTVQLARRVDGVDPPERQVDVFNGNGDFVARVDLAWPQLGLFVELDGQHHEGQPVYDAMRETAVVAATGWLCGRFTWHEVVRLPATTARRLAGLLSQARLRPLAS